MEHMDMFGHSNISFEWRDVIIFEKIENKKHNKWMMIRGSYALVNEECVCSILNSIRA